MALHRKRTRFWRLFGPAFAEMKKNDPLRMAGATAFFTSFALPPILIILFQVFTIFLNRRMVGDEMSQMLTHTFGTEGARQIRITTRGFRTIAQNWYVAAGGFIFLLFVATTLFTVVKNSLNEIWKVKIKEDSKFLLYMKIRGRSLLILLLFGVLFLASLALNGLNSMAGGYLKKVLADYSGFFTGILNEIFSIVVITAWFIILFRFLADGRPSWKVAAVGGCLTGVLFWGGKALLSFLMSHSNIGTIYGASGSLVLLLLFLFYSSFIIYYGASFIKVYSESRKDPITPVSHAYSYELSEVIE